MTYDEVAAERLRDLFEIILLSSEKKMIVSLGFMALSLTKSWSTG